MVSLGKIPELPEIQTMLYDRPYMRQTPGESASDKASMVTTLLVITIGVFVLQQVFNVFFPSKLEPENPFFNLWFGLNGDNFRDLKVWSVLTYGFLHSTNGFMHILGNMLGLFFIGRFIEPILGRDRFLFLYLGSIVLGGLAFLALHFNAPALYQINGDARYVVLVGASAGVFGLLTFFCLLRPEQPITLLLFFILPLVVKPKWLLRVSIAISLAGLLFYEILGQQGVGMNIAHSSHLGGIAAGMLYFQFIHGRSGSLFNRARSEPAVELPEWFKRKSRQPAATRKTTYTVNRSSRDELQLEVDRILDKINSTGFGSLTESEKQTLDRAKDILSK